MKCSAILGANLALYFKAIIALFTGAGPVPKGQIGSTVGCFGFQWVSSVPVVAVSKTSAMCDKYLQCLHTNKRAFCQSTTASDTVGPFHSLKKPG